MLEYSVMANSIVRSHAPSPGDVKSGTGKRTSKEWIPPVDAFLPCDDSSARDYGLRMVRHDRGRDGPRTGLFLGTLAIALYAAAYPARPMCVAGKRAALRSD